MAAGCTGSSTVHFAALFSWSFSAGTFVGASRCLLPPFQCSASARLIGDLAKTVNCAFLACECTYMSPVALPHPPRLLACSVAAIWPFFSSFCSPSSFCATSYSRLPSPNLNLTDLLLLREKTPRLPPTVSASSRLVLPALKQEFVLGLLPRQPHRHFAPMASCYTNEKG